MPGVDAPAASCAMVVSTRVSHHRYTGITRHSRTQWFYGLLRALPGDQACLTPSPALPIADLTPASGRQNDTTWPYAAASFVRLAIARLTPPRPPHPMPNVRDDRETPLCGPGRERICIWFGSAAKQNIFDFGAWHDFWKSEV